MVEIIEIVETAENVETVEIVETARRSRVPEWECGCGGRFCVLMGMRWLWGVIGMLLGFSWGLWLQGVSEEEYLKKRFRYASIAG